MIPHQLPAGMMTMWSWWEQWLLAFVSIIMFRPLKQLFNRISDFRDFGKGRSLSPSESTSSESRIPTKIKFLKTVDDIPGPWPSLPFVGTGWTYWFGPHKLAKLHEANLDKLKNYGKIMKEEFRWGRPLVQVFDAADIELVVKHHVRCPMRPPNEAQCIYRRQHPELYNSTGLVNAQGEEWHRLRSQINPILTRQKTLNQYLPAQNEILDDFVHLIRAVREENGNVADSTSKFYRLALETVAALCLDTRLGCLDEDLQPDSEAYQMIEATYRMFEAYQELHYGLPFWKYFETPTYKKLASSEGTTYKIASKYVDVAMEQVRELKESSCLDKQEAGLAILTSLISETNLNAQDIRMTMVDIIVAGIDTVSNTVLYLLYHLAKNPAVQEKLFDEVEKLLPERSPVTASSLSNLTYLKACIKESFRLTPSIPNIVRILPDDITIQDYLIPAGTPICCHSMVACRMKENFEDPDVFIPERWLDPNTNGMIVLPFGYGPRMCIGRKVAEQEIALTIAKIIQNFQIECLDDTLDCIYRFMVVPSKSLTFRFIDR